MSFILDALKKSETDRQRQSGPSLFEVKVAPPRRTLPVWAAAIAVLLGINVIVISWMLLRHPATQQPAAAGRGSDAAARGSGGAVPLAAPGDRAESAGERPDTASGPGAVASPAGSGTDEARAATSPLTANAAPASPAAEPPAASSSQPATASSSQTSARNSSQALTSSSRGPAVTHSDNDADQGAGQPGATGDPNDFAPAVEPAAGQGSRVPEGTGDGLPLYQQIVTSDGLPSLHLDLHVFAERPRDRFVMINMHRLGEGDSLPGGVQVDAIRPDGVVLTYHGTRFLLPRN
jgi:general secretion pathway protein B